jgi:metaxin
MPPDKFSEKKDEAPPPTQSSFSQQTSKVRDFFSIPAPVKTLFDHVPVLTYPPNELPQRAPKPARIPSLYVFIKKEDAAAGRPSHNPSCLKWQVSEVQIDQETAF